MKDSKLEKKREEKEEGVIIGKEGTVGKRKK